MAKNKITGVRKMEKEFSCSEKLEKELMHLLYTMIYSQNAVIYRWKTEAAGRNIQKIQAYRSTTNILEKKAEYEPKIRPVYRDIHKSVYTDFLKGMGPKSPREFQQV
ncbi:hypothetical protein AABB24_009435 [Solanum stoloniferum]|uniref:Uncharacterized protein n=1 Tax=Solanum stoloniferum TaxID=62892 RepID=A0ABD2UJ98_9SOLN